MPASEHAEFAVTAVPSVTAADFERDVLQSSVPVILLAWMPSLVRYQGARAMDRQHLVAQVAAEAGGQLRVFWLDLDEGDERELAERFEIRAVPSVSPFRDGQKIHRETALTTADKLRDRIRFWFPEVTLSGS